MRLKRTYWVDFAWLFAMMTVFAIMSRSVLVFAAGVALAFVGAWKIRRDVEGRGWGARHRRRHEDDRSP